MLCGLIAVKQGVRQGLLFQHHRPIRLKKNSQHVRINNGKQIWALSGAVRGLLKHANDWVFWGNPRILSEAKRCRARCHVVSMQELSVVLKHFISKNPGLSGSPVEQL
jgi:hypothetical protein